MTLNEYIEVLQEAVRLGAGNLPVCTTDEGKNRVVEVAWGLDVVQIPYFNRNSERAYGDVVLLG